MGENLLDSECDQFSSSDESEGTDCLNSISEESLGDLSDAASIIDDSIQSEHSYSCDMYRALNSTTLDTERDNLQSLSVLFDNEKDDCEMVDLKNKLSLIDYDERLYVLYLLSLSLHKLYVAVETDEVVKCLGATQTAGFQAIINIIKSDSTCVPFTNVLDKMSALALEYRAPRKQTLQKVSDSAFQYFFGDFEDDTTYLKSDIDRRLSSLIDLTALKPTHCFFEKTAISKPPHVLHVRLADSLPNANQSNLEQSSLKELLEWDSQEMENSVDPFAPALTVAAVKVKDKIDLTTVNAWRGLDNEKEAVSLYNASAHAVSRYKEIQVAAINETDTLDTKQRIAFLTSQMPYYCHLVKQLHLKSKLHVEVCRKWAADIMDARNRSIVKQLLEDVSNKTPVVPEEDNLNCSQISVSLTPETAFFPDNETRAAIMRSVSVGISVDERFSLLPVNWKLREGCTAGIFQDIPAINSNCKNLLLVIYGSDNVVKFVDTIPEFLRFNSGCNRVGKLGVYAVENKTATLNSLPIGQLLYVLLTMGRSSCLKDIVGEIVWYLRIKNIAPTEALIEIFNNVPQFEDCYRDVDILRREIDGGFIGPPDDKLRRKLKITEEDMKESRAFQIVFEYFEEKQVKTTAEAVSLCHDIINSVDDSEFKRALLSIIGSANATKQTVNVALWWNKQRHENMPKFLTTNQGLLTFKLARQLFEKVRQLCGGHLLNTSVVIEDWDEETMGPVTYKGTLRQDAILNLVQELRIQQTDLCYVLKTNKIAPTHFFNVVCNKIVRAKRRDKTTIFHGPKRSGKSIIASALIDCFDGVRIPLDIQGGRDFKVDASTSDSVGLVVLEDVQKGTLKDYVDKQLRSHLDGDTVLVNKKMKETSSGSWRAVVITTNECENSDSDEETVPPRKFTIRKNKLLEKRYSHVTFKSALQSGSKHVDSIPETDILALFWRYGLFPTCNTVVNGPVCDYSPCAGTSYEDHHFMCPLVREILSNVQHGISPQTIFHDNTVTEYYERVEPDNLAFVFHLDNVDAIRKALDWHYKTTLSDISSAKQLSVVQQKGDLASEIYQFIEFIYRPLCFLSHYMKGDYNMRKCAWAHRNMLTHPLFQPYVGPSLSTMFHMSTLSAQTNMVEFLDSLIMPWCAPRVVKHTRMQWLNRVEGMDAKQAVELWNVLLLKDKMKTRHLLGEYSRSSARRKRFTRSQAVRLLDEMLDWSVAERFADLWSLLCGFTVKKDVATVAIQATLDTFYD